MAKDPWKKLMRNVSLSAKRHGSVQLNAEIPCIPREVRITERHLQKQFEKQKGRCYWFNIPLIPEDIFKTFYPLAMSVDRLDNTKEYTPDNIVIVCRFANLGRGNINQYQMKKIVKKLRSTSPKQKI